MMVVETRHGTSLPGTTTSLNPMLSTLSRRKRRVVLTMALGSLFMVATVVVVWALSSPKQTYRPGEDIDGLTATLARSLPDEYPRITFTDVSHEAGIDFRHFSGRRRAWPPPTSVAPSHVGP